MQLPSPQQKPPKNGPVGASELRSVELRSLRLPLILRVVYCGLGLGLIGLLILSRTLTPDSSGIGTHQQLGLPPCGFKLLFGAPCPSCGMTTSWALATRGQWIASAQSNLGGFLMALFALPAAVWLLVSGYRGHWVFRKPNPLLIAGTLAMVIAATLIQWTIRVLLV